MTPLLRTVRPWLLAAGVLLTAAFAWHLSRTPPAPPSASPAPVAALPPSDLAPAARAEPAARAGASAALAVVAAASASAIGSEGYGPRIDAARLAADPVRAGQAVQWLLQCRVNEPQSLALQSARDSGAAPAALTLLLEEGQRTARRCQTVTAEHQAMLPELALAALRGQVAGAAVAYAGAASFDELPVDLQREVQAALRRDAAAGDPATLMGAIVSGNRWGLTPDERLTDVAVYVGSSAANPAAAETVKALLAQSDLRDAARDPARVRAAAEAARAVIEAIRARRGPG